MKTVYLSGPMTGLHYDEATDWREYVASHLQPEIGCYSPMRGLEFYRGGNISAADEDHIFAAQQGINTRDRYDVMSTDLTLINVLGATHRSLGTIVEVGWADAYRKPIVLVMEDGNVHDHPMMRGLAGFVVGDLEAAVDVVRGILLPSFSTR